MKFFQDIFTTVTHAISVYVIQPVLYHLIRYILFYIGYLKLIYFNHKNFTILFIFFACIIIHNFNNTNLCQKTFPKIHSKETIASVPLKCTLRICYLLKQMDSLKRETYLIQNNLPQNGSAGFSEIKWPCRRSLRVSYSI